MSKETIKRSDFSEETIYVVQCPACEEMIETSDDPSYESIVICDNCHIDFDLED